MLKKTMLAAASLALSLPAAAQEAQPYPPDAWRFQLTSYAWLPHVSGDIRPRAGLPTFSASLSARDILKDLNGAFFLTGTARRDRFVLLGDLTWSYVSQTETFNTTRLPVPFPVPVSITGKVTQASATAAVGYSVVEQPDFVLDLLGGARVWQTRASVAAEARIAPQFTLGAAGSQTVRWVDPIVAARFRYQLTPDWSVIGYGDVGGFGAGSRLTWQLYGTVNYRMTDHLYVSAGYRHMSVDYRDNGMLLDFDMSGPILGATWRF